MPHFWLTYGDANRIIGAIIVEAPTMLQARMDAAVRGLDRGAAFAEGHHLSADLIASVPSTKIGQMISGAEAAQLLGLLKGRRPIEQTKQQAAIAAELTVQERVLLFRLASGTEGTGRRHRRDSDRNARPRLG